MRRTTVLRSSLAAILLSGSAFMATSSAAPATGQSTVPMHGIGPGAQASPAPFALPTQYEGKDLIVVLGVGTGENLSKQPNAFDITVPLVSAATGEVIGTARHEPKCAEASVAPCVILDDHDTYDLGDGTIEAKGRVSLPPDPDRPGFHLSTGQPTENNIVKATGAYAGRTGIVRVFGYVDARQAPGQFGLSEVYVIALDRKK